MAYVAGRLVIVYVLCRVTNDEGYEVVGDRDRTVMLPTLQVG